MHVNAPILQMNKQRLVDVPGLSTVTQPWVPEQGLLTLIQGSGQQREQHSPSANANLLRARNETIGDGRRKDTDSRHM